MTAPTIATDDAVLADLLDLRKAGLPGWTYITANNATRTVSIRLTDPAALAAWHSTMGSQAEIVPEPYPASAMVFHYTNVTDWLPGWTFYMTAVVRTMPPLADTLSVERFGRADR